MTNEQPRVVTLALCDRDGRVLGSLPPQEVDVGWWPETRDIVASTRARYGVEVVVLRLLDASLREPPGGLVSYLAEVQGAVPVELELAPWQGDPVEDQPLRQTWAQPGGPTSHLAWANKELDRLGAQRTEPPQQIRTWNLSTLWRFPTAEGAAWLKVVPPFFAHEGALMARLDPAAVPTVLATDGPRLLLAELAGDDLYDAPLATLLAMVDLLVALQATWPARVDELIGLGLPDWRAGTFPEFAEYAVEQSAADLDPGTATTLARLLGGLPARFDDLASCGVPDTLVHGDFHPGNVLSASEVDESDLRIHDWGDGGVGHPMLDQAAFLQRQPEPNRVIVRAHWSGLWRDAVPGCEPERAAALVAPVAALRQAVIYQMFLDNIEPDERVYHHTDPATWLVRAAERFAQERSTT